MSSPGAVTASGRPEKPTIGGGVHGPVKKAIDKKEGAGTFGAWGRPGIDDLKGAEDAVNEVEAGEQEVNGVVLSEVDVSARREAESLKQEILDLLEEYAEEGDLQETVTSLRLLPDIPAAEFIKRALIMGIERHSRERELISRLLCEVHELFEGKGYSEGFQSLLFRLPDLVIDVPDAADYLGLFIARALYDDVLPPAFLKDAQVDNEHAKLACSLAYNVYHNPAERTRLENVWGAATSVASLSSAVDSILKEYLDSLELNACTLAIQELQAPSFAAQIVKQGIILALERDTPKARTQMVSLFDAWLQQGVFTDFNLKKGVDLVRNSLPDYLPDIPHASDTFASFCKEAAERGLPI